MYSDLIKAAKAKAKPYTGKGQRKGTPGNYTYTYADKSTTHTQLDALLAVDGRFEVGSVYVIGGYKYTVTEVTRPTDAYGYTPHFDQITLDVDLGTNVVPMGPLRAGDFLKQLRAEEARLGTIQKTIEHYTGWSVDFGNAHVEGIKAEAPERADGDKDAVEVTLRITALPGSPARDDLPKTVTVEALYLRRFEDAIRKGAAVYGGRLRGDGRVLAFAGEGSGHQREVIRLRRISILHDEVKTIPTQVLKHAADYDIDDLMDVIDGASLPFARRTSTPSSTRSEQLHDVLDLKRISSEQADVLTAIELFTKHNVAAVRDPSLFDPARADNVNLRGWTLSRGGKGASTKAIYERANEIMKDLAAAPYDPSAPETMYRGMRLSLPAVQDLTEGVVFDGGEIASWTGTEQVADGFAAGNEPSAPKIPVVFVVQNPTRGTYIADLSGYANEDEIVSSGKMRVISTTMPASSAEDRAKAFKENYWMGLLASWRAGTEEYRARLTMMLDDLEAVAVAQGYHTDRTVHDLLTRLETAATNGMGKARFVPGAAHQPRAPEIAAAMDDLQETTDVIEALVATLVDADSAAAESDWGSGGSESIEAWAKFALGHLGQTWPIHSAYAYQYGAEKSVPVPSVDDLVGLMDDITSGKYVSTYDRIKHTIVRVAVEFV